jgi:hypothetical protein
MTELNPFEILSECIWELYHQVHSDKCRCKFAIQKLRHAITHLASKMDNGYYLYPEARQIMIDGTIQIYLVISANGACEYRLIDEHMTRTITHGFTTLEQLGPQVLAALTDVLYEIVVRERKSTDGSL